MVVQALGAPFHGVNGPFAMGLGRMPDTSAQLRVARSSPRYGILIGAVLCGNVILRILKKIIRKHKKEQTNLLLNLSDFIIRYDDFLLFVVLQNA